VTLGEDASAPDEQPIGTVEEAEEAGTEPG
jgi:hypothetical protein